MNKATEALIPRLIESINSHRNSAIARIDSYVQQGNLDRAKEYADGYRNGTYDCVIRRPRKIRVATMEAAGDYLKAHKPNGVAGLDWHRTYQNNGNPDAYIRVTFSDFPAFASFVGPEAAIRMAWDAAEARDEADRAWSNTVASYYTMKEAVADSMPVLANLLVTLRNTPNHDREQRLRITALVGQLRRDADHTFLATPDDELRYLYYTASDLHNVVYSLDNERTAGKVVEAINAFRSNKRQATTMRERANEVMDRADEFEQSIRNGTLLMDKENEDND